MAVLEVTVTLAVGFARDHGARAVLTELEGMFDANPDAIRAFAGDDITTAVVEPEALMGIDQRAVDRVTAHVEGS